MDSEEHVQSKRKEQYGEEGGMRSYLQDANTSSRTITPSLPSLSTDAEEGGGGAMTVIITIMGPIPTRG